MEKNLKDEDKKISSTSIKMKPEEGRIGTKIGAHGKEEPFDLDSGKFTNVDAIQKQIRFKNNDRSLLSSTKKISYKNEFWEPEGQIHFKRGNKEHTVRPVLFDDNGRGYFIAELDQSKREIKVKVEVGREIRLNLVNSQQDLLGVGSVKYVVDAASVGALIRGSISSGKGKMNAEVHIEGGILGPNAAVNFKSVEICLFGFTIQSDVSVRGGTGIKGALGAGGRIDILNSKFKTYVKLGGYYGVGMETELNTTLGLDKGMNYRYEETIKQLSAGPLFNLDKINAAIEATPAHTDSKTNLTRYNLEQVRDDMREARSNVALSTAWFHINRDSSSPQKSASSEGQSKNSSGMQPRPMPASGFQPLPVLVPT